MADSGVPADAGPDAPVVLTVAPDSVFENQGSGTMARAIPIVVEGEGFTTDAEITASPADALVFEGSTVVATDGTWAARLARVPLDANVGAGETSEVMVVVTQGSGTASGTIEVVALDELTIENDPEVDVAELSALYSEIAITDAVRFTGTAPARLVATGDIRVSAAITAESGSCRGGREGFSNGPADDGDCGAGGGGGAISGDSGGGGGGNATEGEPGTGSAPGSGGAITGNEMVVPLGGENGNRGNGGGGGSGGNEGGPGGDGGGVIELSAGGQVLIEAELSADGEEGTEGDAAAGGGGGSGGIILMRGGGVVEVTSSGTVHARGGPGQDDGGDGGLGRIRIDNPNAQPSGVFPAPARGPMWLPTTPGIVTDENSELRFAGDNRTYFVSVNGGALAAAPTPDGTGQASIDVTLEPGLNTVCAHVVNNASANLDEAKNCIDVAFIPE